MPVRKVQGGYQWGTSGKVYPARAQSEVQGCAAYVNSSCNNSIRKRDGFKGSSLFVFQKTEEKFGEYQEYAYLCTA